MEVSMANGVRLPATVRQDVSGCRADSHGQSATTDPRARCVASCSGRPRLCAMGHGSYLHRPLDARRL
jgi:hypothetical protein